MKTDNFLPNVSEYTKLLNIASFRFNLSIDECRNRYGLYSNKQWYDLLNNE